jgi:exonuclease SbcD
MKTAIAAILADTHLKEDNIEINKSIYRQASEIAISLGLKKIDHAADIFNSRKSQSQLVLTTFKQILDELHEKGLVLESCVGNHDKTDYGAVESFLDPFAEHPAFILHRRSGGFLERGNDEIGYTDIAYLSYFTDDIYLKELEHLSSHVTNEKTVLITHIGISGAVMNNGTVIESESITPSVFNKFALTLVGHYHDAQTLAGGRIKYIGSSLQHNFGELTGKGLTILYDDLTTEIIPLKYPQYIKYEVSPKDLTSKDIADLKAEREQTGDNIRIILTGSDADIKSFNKQILIDAGVSVEKKSDKIEAEELEQRVEAFDTVSLKTEFEGFCTKNNLDINQGMKYFNNVLTA